MEYISISEIATGDPAIKSDLFACVQRMNGKTTKIIQCSVEDNKNMLGKLLKNFNKYKPVSTFGGMVKWVKK